MAFYGSLLSSYDIRYLINEAFVGKTETLLEMENQINKIRASIHKFTDINKNKEVQKLNRLFEKQFGMEVFGLNIVQSNTIDAYSAPINTRFDVVLKQNISKMVEGSKTTGYRFKEGNGLGIICYIHWGLLMNPDFTDEEILAVILHELGHNFADALYDKIKFYNKEIVESYYSWKIFIAIVTFGLKSKALRQNKNSYVKKKLKNKKSNPIRGIIQGFKGAKEDFSEFVDEVFSRLGKKDSSKAKQTLNTIDIEKQKKYIKTKNIDRQDEVIADLFAGVYGYGPAQVSALLKMGDYKTSAEKFVEKIPIIGKIKNQKFNDIGKDLYIFDEHPHIIQRAIEEIKLLEDELKKSDLDPKLEAVMKAQIKQMKDLLEKATTIVDESQKSENSKKEFYKFIMNEDPDALSEEIEDEIFAALDAGLEKK